MLRKLVLGLTAAAALSATALMPTAASAGWKGWHHHHHHHGFWGGGYGVFAGGYGGCYVKRLVETPYGLRYRVVNVCY